MKTAKQILEDRCLYTVREEEIRRDDQITAGEALDAMQEFADQYDPENPNEIQLSHLFEEWNRGYDTCNQGWNEKIKSELENIATRKFQYNTFSYEEVFNKLTKLLEELE